MEMLIAILIIIVGFVTVIGGPAILVAAVVRDTYRWLVSDDKWNFHKLVNCRSCFKEVSCQADVCPHCRDPHPAWRN